MNSKHACMMPTEMAHRALGAWQELARKTRISREKRERERAQYDDMMKQWLEKKEVEAKRMAPRRALQRLIQRNVCERGPMVYPDLKQNIYRSDVYEKMEIESREPSPWPPSMPTSCTPSAGAIRIESLLNDWPAAPKKSPHYKLRVWNVLSQAGMLPQTPVALPEVSISPGLAASGDAVKRKSSRKLSESQSPMPLELDSPLCLTPEHEESDVPRGSRLGLPLTLHAKTIGNDDSDSGDGFSNPSSRESSSRMGTRLTKEASSPQNMCDLCFALGTFSSQLGAKVGKAKGLGSGFKLTGRLAAATEASQALSARGRAGDRFAEVVKAVSPKLRR